MHHPQQTYQICIWVVFKEILIFSVVYMTSFQVCRVYMRSLQPYYSSCNCISPDHVTLIFGQLLDTWHRIERCAVNITRILQPYYSSCNRISPSDCDCSRRHHVTLIFGQLLDTWYCIERCAVNITRILQPYYSSCNRISPSDCDCSRRHHATLIFGQLLDTWYLILDTWYCIERCAVNITRILQSYYSSCNRISPSDCDCSRRHQIALSTRQLINPWYCIERCAVYVTRTLEFKNPHSG